MFCLPIKLGLKYDWAFFAFVFKLAFNMVSVIALSNNPSASECHIWKILRVEELIAYKYLVHQTVVGL
jgi:hypothetical protein